MGNHWKVCFARFWLIFFLFDGFLPRTPRKAIKGLSNWRYFLSLFSNSAKFIILFMLFAGWWLCTFEKKRLRMFTFRASSIYFVFRLDECLRTDGTVIIIGKTINDSVLSQMTFTKVHSHHSKCRHNALSALANDNAAARWPRHLSYIGLPPFPHLKVFGGRVVSAFGYQSGLAGSTPACAGM